MVYIEPGRVGRRRNLEEFIANLPNVQAEVDRKADIIAKRAKASLAYHRLTGNAKIVQMKGDVDAYVVLEDTSSSNKRSGGNSALSIEQGRAHDRLDADGEEAGGMEGLHILAYATYFSKRRAR